MSCMSLRSPAARRSSSLASSSSSPSTSSRNAVRRAPAVVVRAQSADKEAAIKSLRSLKSGASAALAKHEEELKNSVRASASAAGAADASSATTTSELTELDSENFWKFVKEDAGTSLVVVDFYTTWCGPCKLMMPKLVEFAKARDGKMLGAKFNCNKANEALGKQLGVRSVPTFKLYKGGEEVAMMTGAKPEELEKLIDEHL